MTELIKRLTQVSGASSNEGAIRELITKEVSPYADEISVDNIGNLIVRKRGNGKKIMLSAHMDEVGFFVTFIEESGLIRVSPIGSPSLLASAFSEVVSENGVFGVLASESGDKAPKATELYIDIGAKDRRQAEGRVKLGECFTLVPKMKRLLGQRYIGRPLVSRVGCAILIEAIKQIKSPKNDLYFVFTAQKELGMRGAMPASYKIEPDVGITVETAPARCPGSSVKLGEGCGIKLKSGGVIASPWLVDKIRTLAKEGAIKHQSEILEKAESDASAIQMTRTGAPVSGISVPCAFVHTGCEMIDMNDVKSALALTLKCCEELDI